MRQEGERARPSWNGRSSHATSMHEQSFSASSIKSRFKAHFLSSSMMTTSKICITRVYVARVKETLNVTAMKNKSGIKSNWFVQNRFPSRMTARLTFDVQRFDHVVVEQFEVLVSDPVLDVSLPTREEVVGHRDLVAHHHQLVHQVWPHEPCTPSHL